MARNNLSLNLKVGQVPMCCDVLSVVLVLVCAYLLSNKNVVVPEEAKLALLLAVIVLISVYNIEIAILVVIIAIVFVLVKNNLMKRDDENQN